MVRGVRIVCFCVSAVGGPFRADVGFGTCDEKIKRWIWSCAIVGHWISYCEDFTSRADVGIVKKWVEAWD